MGFPLVPLSKMNHSFFEGQNAATHSLGMSHTPNFKTSIYFRENSYLG